MNKKNLFPFRDQWRTGKEELFGEKFSNIDLKKMVTIGSCISRNIIRWLDLYNISENKMPYDILYNPFSINSEIKRLFDEVNWKKGVFQYKDEKGFIVVKDPWRTWITANSIKELDNKNKQLDKEARNVLKEASSFFITYGLSEIWNLKSDDKMILNRVPIECINQGQEKWKHRFALVGEVVDAISETIDIINKNVGKVPIFIASTPGPLKYTASDVSIRYANNISKAILTQSFYEIVNKYDNVEYFPTMEILQSLEEKDIGIWQDDRRHITADAIEYFGRQLVLCCGNKESRNKIKQKNDFWVPKLSKNGKITGKLFINKNI